MKKLIPIIIAFGVIFATFISVPSYAQEMSIQSGVQSARGDGQPGTLFGAGGIFTTIVNILLFIIGALSVIMLIIGGIRYTVSGGNQSAITAAKNTIMYAIVGIIIAVLAYAIVNFVLSALIGGGTGSGTDV
jgi:ABC-type Fe3+ transport system permease subunit